MKRFLLTLVCAIAMVAVNAQPMSGKIDMSQLSKVQIVKGQTLKRMNVAAPIKLSNANMQVMKTTKNLPAKSKSMVAPASLENMEGAWVEEHTEWADEMTPFNIASSIESSIDEDEEGNDVLVLSGVAQGYADIFGYYDAEAATLSIQSGYVCGTYKDTYDLVFFSLTEKDGELYLSDEDYVLNVQTDENGHVSMTSTNTFGWCLAAFEGEKYVGNLTDGDELILNAANYEISGYSSLNTGSGYSNWAPFETEYAYVENIEGTVIIHGMLGSSFMLAMNDNGIEFTIPNGQTTGYDWASDTEYITWLTYNCAIEGTSIRPQYDESYQPVQDFELPGYISSDDSYVFASYDPETGELDEWDYFWIANIDEDGSGYAEGWWTEIVVSPFENTVTSISSVASSSKANNNITFNMAGQKVSKDYKGLVIRNGQKFMNK